MSKESIGIKNATLAVDKNYMPDAEFYKQKFEEIRLKHKMPNKFSNYIKAKIQSSTTPRKKNINRDSDQDYGEYKQSMPLKSYGNLK